MVALEGCYFIFELLAASSVPFLPTRNGNVIRYSSSLYRRIIASRFAAVCHANILQRN